MFREIPWDTYQPCVLTVDVQLVKVYHKHSLLLPESCISVKKHAHVAKLPRTPCFESGVTYISPPPKGRNVICLMSIITTPVLFCMWVSSRKSTFPSLQFVTFLDGNERSQSKFGFPGPNYGRCCRLGPVGVVLFEALHVVRIRTHKSQFRRAISNMFADM